MRVVVVGAGSWGTAFAALLAEREHDVALVARDPEHARAIAEAGRNPPLHAAARADLVNGRMAA